MPFLTPAISVPRCLLWFAGISAPTGFSAAVMGEGRAAAPLPSLSLAELSSCLHDNSARTGGLGEIPAGLYPWFCSATGCCSGASPPGPGESPFHLPSPARAGSLRIGGSSQKEKKDPHTWPPEILRALTQKYPRRLHFLVILHCLLPSALEEIRWCHFSRLRAGCACISCYEHQTALTHPEHRSQQGSLAPVRSLCRLSKEA